MFKKLAFFPAAIFCLSIIFALAAGATPKQPSETATAPGNTENILIKGQENVPIRPVILKEELSIGGENLGDDYMLVRPGPLDVDAEGNIYLLDKKMRALYVFNSKGKPLLHFGVKGEGPGEWLLAFDMVLDEKSKMIHVLDFSNRKITRHSMKGDFVDETRLTIAPRGFYLNPDNAYMLRHKTIDDQGNYQDKISLYSIKGEYLDKTLQLDTTYAMYTENQGELEVTFRKPFRPSNYFAFDRNGGTLFIGNSGRYRLDIYSPGLSKIRSVEVEGQERIKVTSAEKDEFIKARKKKYLKKGIAVSLKNLQFPAYHPIFVKLLADDKGCVWVGKYSKDEKAHVDVISREGKLLRKMIIHPPEGGISIDSVFRAPVIKDEKIFAAVRDENGDYYIKKYALSQYHPD